MKTISMARLLRALPAFVPLLGAAGCGGLLPAAPEPPAQFALDRAATVVRVAAPASAAPRGSIIVGAPRATAGFDSSRIVYVRQPHQLEYFAYNQWVDPPAQMLWPLIAEALESSAAFSAVLVSPSPATGDWRLDVELLRLQQEFTESPSRVRVSLRVHLIDSRSRSVVASKVLETTETAASDDPYGGVVAANQAVSRLVGELAGLVAAAVQAAPQPAGTLPAGAALPLPRVTAPAQTR